MKRIETKMKQLSDCCACDSLHPSVRPKTKCKPPGLVRQLLSPQIGTVLPAKMPKSIMTWPAAIEDTSDLASTVRLKVALTLRQAGLTLTSVTSN